MAAAQDPFPLTRFDLPGLNLPLNFTPGRAMVDFGNGYGLTELNNFEGRRLFRTALIEDDRDEGYISLRLTPVRELTMLHIMDVLTDKPGWEEKVFNDEIANKWKIEALSAEGRDVTQSMVDWIVEELRYKAKIFKETGCVTVYDGDVVKSDTVIPSPIRASLQQAVKALEDIPEFYKDYHPDSDGKVLDLVHPSLFPLIYGKSRVLPDSLIGIDDCLEYCGKGVVVPIRPDEETSHYVRLGGRRRNSPEEAPYSKHFQWLPSEVEFDADGKAKFVSYINNLHPQEHKSLYSIIEEVLDRSIPLWNITLTPLIMEGQYRAPRFTRNPYSQVVYDPDPEQMSDSEIPQQEDGEEEHDYYERLNVWEDSIRRVVVPEPGPFEGPSVHSDFTDSLEPGTTDKMRADLMVDLKRDFLKRGLQVIVKLANIELTPDKPSYAGGTWHVEGQLNEHICATALYYYDSHNITPSRLAFRHHVSPSDVNDIHYAQDKHDFMQAVFGLDPDGSTVQETGSVACLQGRLLTFPNIIQHKVAPFQLADATQPGHRKILALFLVDPAIRIISTANVPPQQRDWWSEALVQDLARSRAKITQLSPELMDKIFESVDDFPIAMEEAKEIRLKLMEERKDFVVEQKEAFESARFSLCEH